MIAVSAARWAGWLGEACPYCGEAMIATHRRKPTRDHLTPSSRGGSEDAHNTRIVCSDCNQDRGDRTLWEWAAALRLGGDARAARIARLVAAAYGEAAE